MPVYTCRECQVVFDSKVWYEGHLLRTHDTPIENAHPKPEDLSTSPASSTDSTLMEQAHKAPLNRWSPKRLFRRLSLGSA
ncbi:hypothetical protein DL89DRAFT_272212 [Linderina pennispora]|uniref:C2H2-type domain-containing protein n=1 Tax=Linderina pennispora TaxID=61395 RepID=A0A1Y1VU90_9FUNG|nr:uncharacterized protein DL89DRAFT_272212 [Linderina pennispora]ORX64576.1 hypothetical protein DL89DRAFT_272212 [Linderina pennispora]